MSALFHCVVRAKPVPQGRARVPRFGKPYYSKTSVAFRNLLWAAFDQDAREKDLDEIDFPVSVTIEVAGVRANGDLDNVAKGVLDALQDANVLASDDVRVVQELIVRVVDGEPRTSVTIRMINEQPRAYADAPAEAQRECANCGELVPPGCGGEFVGDAECALRQGTEPFPDYAALEYALKACVEALETTCRELHKAGGHVFASLGEDAIAAARSVLK